MEQTETPELLAARNEQRRAQGLKKVRCQCVAPVQDRQEPQNIVCFAASATIMG